MAHRVILGYKPVPGFPSIVPFYLSALRGIFFIFCVMVITPLCAEDTQPLADVFEAGKDSKESQEFENQLSELNEFVRASLIEAVTSDVPIVGDSAELFFGKHQNLYRSWSKSDPMMEFDRATVFSPIRTKLTKKVVFKITSAEKARFSSRLREGAEFRDQHFENMWRNFLTSSRPVSKAYLRVQKLLRLQPRIRTILALKRITNTRARELAAPVFMLRFHENPETKDHDLKRTFGRMVHRNEEFVEDPKLVKFLVPEHLSRVEAIREVDEILRILHDGYKNEYRYSGSDLNFDLRTPFSDEYQYLFEQLIVEDLRFLLVSFRARLTEWPRRDLYQIFQTYKKRFESDLSAKKTGFLVESKQTFSQNFFSYEFTQFMADIKWWGLKQSPTYWHDRDAQVNKGRLFYPKTRSGLIKTIGTAKKLVLTAIMLAKLSGWLFLGHTIWKEFESPGRLLNEVTSWVNTNSFALEKPDWLKKIEQSFSSETQKTGGEPSEENLNLGDDFRKPGYSNRGEKDVVIKNVRVTDAQGRLVTANLPLRVSSGDWLNNDLSEYGLDKITNVPPSTRDFDLKVEVLTSQTLRNGKVVIPTPPGFRLVGIDYSADTSISVFRNSTGIYSLRRPHYYLDGQQGTVKWVDAYFAATSEHEKYAGDPRLYDVSKNHISLQSTLIREAFFEDISNYLNRLVADDKRKISVHDLASAISETSVYTISPPRYTIDELPIMTGNWYREEFVRHRVGKAFHGKCDYGNAFLAGFLYHTLSSWVNVVRVNEFFVEDGHLISPGHSQIELFINGKLAVRLDGTPLIGGDAQMQDRIRGVHGFFKKNSEFSSRRLAFLRSSLAKKIQSGFHPESMSWAEIPRRRERDVIPNAAVPEGFVGDPPDRAKILEARREELQKDQQQKAAIWLRQARRDVNALVLKLKKVFAETHVELTQPNLPQREFIQVLTRIQNLLNGYESTQGWESWLGENVDFLSKTQFGNLVEKKIMDISDRFYNQKNKVRQNRSMTARYITWYSADIEKLMFEVGYPLLVRLSNEIPKYTNQFHMWRFDEGQPMPEAAPRPLLNCAEIMKRAY